MYFDVFYSILMHHFFMHPVCHFSVSCVSRLCFRFSNLLHTFSVVVRGRRYVLQLQALLFFLLVITATRQTFLKNSL